MRSKRMLWIALIIAVILIIAGMGFSLFLMMNEKNINKVDDDGNIVKDNVFVITKDDENQPIEVNDNAIIFAKNVKYRIGDVIVSDVIDAAPNGFIRKVVGYTKEEGQYIVATEPATLVDVFEEAHVDRVFELSEDGVKEVDKSEIPEVETQASMQATNYTLTSSGENNIKNMSLNNVNNISDGMTMVDFSSHKESENKKTQEEKLKVGLSENYTFGVSFEKKIDEHVSVSGEVGFSPLLEVKFDIEKGEIVFSAIFHNEQGYALQAGYDFIKEWDITDKYSELCEIFSEELEPFTFWVSWVPVVITNELRADITLNAKIEGSVGISYSESETRKIGVEYTSKTGQIKEINEKENDSDGLKWDSAELSGECNSGVQVHLVSLLYGISGLDATAGIEGNIDGNVEMYASSKGEELGGELNLYIGPVLKGTLVVQTPVIHKKLVEAELFKVELLPFWSDTWEKKITDIPETETSEETRAQDNSVDNSDEVSVPEYKKIYDNTYKTRRAIVDMITCPVFEFDYPDGWSVNQETLETDYEWDIIENQRGVTINFFQFKPGMIPQASVGAGTKQINHAQVTKVADSIFVPGWVSGTDEYSDLGKFIIAKVKVDSYEDLLNGGNTVEVDGPTLYAIVPESYVGEIQYTGLGYQAALAWDYPDSTVVYVESPNGVFTPEEESEVINMLSSFREGTVSMDDYQN